jgi:hypothetical protein
MPVPVISPITGLFVLDKDVAMTPHTPFASETPTSWAATGLPTGLSLTAGTGKISGTPTVAGVSTVSLKATNASGDSAPMVFPIKVLDAPAANDDGLVLLNFDLQTGLVSNPALASTAPQAYAKNDDKIAFAIGIVNDSVLRRLTITNIKVVLRDTYDSPICTLYDAAPAAPLNNEAPRYRVLCDFTAADVLNTLGEHDGDSSAGGTDYELAAKCEITLTHAIDSIGGTTSIPRTSVTFPFHLAKRLATS